MKKLICFDLDGTLTQHKQPLSAQTRQTLTRLSEKYKLLMVGAGQVYRIFNQMEKFPVDIIGNYGLQQAKYNPDKQDLDIIRDERFPCDREKTEAIVTGFREKYGFTQHAGDNVEYHPSGCITFPILGTKAQQADKLAFDPDRSRRRPLLPIVQAANPEYNVFVGGTSSFDMTPKEYEILKLLCGSDFLDEI